MSKIFRIIGWLEGISFLALLCIAMPLKYFGDTPGAVKLIGPLHGGLFIAYCVLAFLLANSQDWPHRQHLLAYAAAILPFGTFLFERKFNN